MSAMLDKTNVPPAGRRMSFQQQVNTRRESRTIIGRFRGGKLAPVYALRVGQSEGGMLQQSITLELDPMAGRLITPITAELISVFVPVQAMHALRNPTEDYAGLTEVIRQKLLSGTVLFPVGFENPISRLLRINPRVTGGVKQISAAVHTAHNCAVNFLRKRKYDKAAQLLSTNTGVTPALISSTALERLNGVLDPDDRINGSVQLDIPNMMLPVDGIGFEAANPLAVSVSAKVNTGVTAAATESGVVSDNTSGRRVMVETTGAGATLAPAVFARLNGAAAGNVSLTDFYNAETMDKLTRVMRGILDDNPEYGEEMLLAWAHGLNVDAGVVPWVLSEQTKTFGRNIVGATDTGGVEDRVMRSDMMLNMSFTVPIPKTELGGIIVTFATVKPDETFAAQPHPFLSEPWGAENYAADQLKLDPVPVTIRDLFSDHANPGTENTVMMYTGYNALKQTYIDYGFNRLVDRATIENRTAVWQLQIPLSVTPESILYPEVLDHYPFADQNAEVCTYVVQSNAVIGTPMVFGPTPIEEMDVIGDEGIFQP